MPVKAVRVLGARSLADRRKDSDKVRRKVCAAVKWYGSTKWRKRRAQQLSDEPWCAYCIRDDGRYVAANVADHVVPHRDDETKFWAGRLQSLCGPCHNSKKQSEERGARRG